MKDDIWDLIENIEIKEKWLGGAYVSNLNNR